ncbi:MAG: hypothetical protein IKE18_08930 [Oscillospiraceae bacterium]|nr:hypothetical protein [Oscillospiraceae bacterium]
MENANIKRVAETLAVSMENSQANAIDTERAVDQVLTMSGKEVHEQIVNSILSDNELSMSEKLDLIHRENANYDLYQENNTDRLMRLQTTQTHNIEDISSWWSHNWGWIILSGSIAVITLGTPQGKKIISTVVNYLAS